MSTKKEDIVPWKILLVTKTLHASPTPGGALVTGYIDIPIDSKIVVTNKPKKYEGIRCVEIKYGSLILYSYYCDIRYKHRLIVKSMKLKHKLQYKVYNLIFNLGYYLLKTKSFKSVAYKLLILVEDIQPKTVICKRCDKAFLSAIPSDLDKGYQGVGCASNFRKIDDIWYLQATYGSSYDGNRYKFMATPFMLLTDADPVCDECIMSWKVTGMLKQIPGNYLFWYEEELFKEMDID